MAAAPKMPGLPGHRQMENKRGRDALPALQPKEENMIAILMFALLTAPPAAQVLAVIVAVYGLIQGLKQIPALKPWITGWKAVLLNGLLTAGGLLVTIPADQLYTLNTLLSLVATMAGSAGIHGTVTALSKPTPAPAKPHPLN
jgi:hypothetical protein